MEVFNENKHGGVIAVGGGSSMDTGKGIAFMCGQTRPLWDYEDISDYWTRADSSKIKPIIDKVFSFTEADKAHTYIQDRKNFGKVLLDFRGK